MLYFYNRKSMVEITTLELQPSTKDLIDEVKEKLIELTPIAEKRGVEKYTYDSMIWFIFHDWLSKHEEENKNEKE